LNRSLVVAIVPSRHGNPPAIGGVLSPARASTKQEIFMPEQTVSVSGRQISLEEARAGMDQAIVERIKGHYPNADSDAQQAQAFVDAYSREHKNVHGQDFTGQRDQGQRQDQPGQGQPR
jgi:Anti-CRISPR protein AcrIC5